MYIFELKETEVYKQRLKDKKKMNRLWNVYDIIEIKFPFKRKVCTGTIVVFTVSIQPIKNGPKFAY